jgi:hypothetical protein
MTYVLRFVQSYKPAHKREFLALEAKFQELELESETLPKGRRSQPVAGNELTNSLIWECEFDSLASVQEALRCLEDNPAHALLLEQQAPYIERMRTEILERVRLKA